MDIKKKLGKTAIFTIAARNYLSQVSVLFDSLEKFSNEFDFYCFVVDGFDDTDELPENLRPYLRDCRSLGIDGFEDMSFKYDVIEFSTALKPYLFNYIFSQLNYQRASYFDPDIKFYDDFSWLEDGFSSNSILVTPHLLDIEKNFYPVGERPTALALNTFLSVGIFNLGFIGIANDEVGRRFTNWWMGVLFKECLVDGLSGLYVDQKWANYLMCFCLPRLKIYTDSGLNVAYWNIHERKLTTDTDGTYYINNSRLKFMHFSSIDLTEENSLSKGIRNHKYVNFEKYSEYKHIFSAYKEELINSGFTKLIKTPYRFNFFDDGTRISQFHRKLYLALGKNQEINSPFLTKGEFFQLLKRKGLLKAKDQSNDLTETNVKGLTLKRNILELVFYIAFRVLGERRYSAFLKELRRLSRTENQLFLIKK